MKTYVVFVKSVIDEPYDLFKGEVMGVFNERQSQLAYTLCKTMNSEWQNKAKFDVGIRHAMKITDIFKVFEPTII